MPIRLPDNPSEGVEFSDWLLDAESRRQTRNRVSVFLHQWDSLRDRLGREPRMREYTDRWRVPYAVAYREANEVREIFGVEPGTVCQLLWEGMRQQQDWGRRPGGLMRVFGVRVVPVDSELSR